MSELYLKHYGVKGQKKGVRRYQNEDGSLTSLGHQRYEEMRKQLEIIYPGWEDLKTMDDKKLSMVYDGLISRNEKMKTKINEYHPDIDVEKMEYEEKKSLYDNIQKMEKEKTIKDKILEYFSDIEFEKLSSDEKKTLYRSIIDFEKERNNMEEKALKHSIDNGLSIVSSIINDDHLEHHNENHDELGRFAPAGSAKINKYQHKINKNNSKIEKLQKKINPNKQIKADKLDAKAAKYAKAKAKATKRELKGKEISDRLAKKAEKYDKLTNKSDLINSKNNKLNAKISELESMNSNYQKKLDKLLKKYEYEDVDDFNYIYIKWLEEEYFDN